MKNYKGQEDNYITGLLLDYVNFKIIIIWWQ